MKIINYDLIQIYNILDANGNKKFPQKISFAITKNLIELKLNIDIYQKALQKLFEQYKDYVEINDDGTPKTNEQGLPIVQEDHQEEFNKELVELLNTEIEINPYQIEMEVFNYEDERYDVLTASEMFNLQKILCNLNEEKKEE